MSEHADSTTREGLTARLRLAAALGATPIGKDEAGQDVAQWLLDEVGAVPSAEVFVTVDGALDQVTGVLGGATGGMLGPLSKHLGWLGADPDEVERVRELGPVIAPTGVSLWLEARPAGLAAGWGLHGELEAAAVLAAMPDNAAREALVALVEELGIEVIHELRVSLGTGLAGHFCRLAVQRDLVAVARAAAGALGVEAFADELVGLLAGADGTGAAGGPGELVVGLNDEGVCGFGVSADGVGPAVVIRLVDALGGDEAALATFEGILGANERDAMLWLDAAGARALFTYRVWLGG